MESNLMANENIETTITKERNKLCTWGFYIGISSIFLSFIGIIPLSGIVISLIGLIKFNKEKNKSLWMGVVGFILNVLYLLVNAHSNGHI
jgi:hypothetical protein